MPFMQRPVTLEVQGHRGARGLAPENTLAGFEIALDLGVASIETDVHLTGDGEPILVHDEHVAGILVASIALNDLRGVRVKGPACGPTPIAERCARDQGSHPLAPPTVSEFFAFVQAYADSIDKTAAQRDNARRLIFDLELKRVPFHPEFIGDDGGLLEERVADTIQRAGVAARTRVRSFDHRSVRAMRRLLPALETAILVHNTAPCDVAVMLDAAGASVYCPDYRFVDAELIEQVHRAGKRVIPYTVNDPRDWERLIAWGVDGVTTDVPDRLIEWIRRHDGQRER